MQFAQPGIVPQAKFDSLTDAARKMQASAREAGPSADSKAQEAAQVSSTSRNGRSEVVTQLNAQAS